MRLTVLGCAGSFPSATSPASGYLLEHDGHWIVLDLGAGSFGALQRHTAPDAVASVLLSHLHPDHCSDLCGCYVARRHRPGGALPALPVHGPAGTSARLAQIYGTSADPGMREVFAFSTHRDAYAIGPFTITTTRVVHPVEAYAIRVAAGGRTLVYSGDTAPTDALVELARGADLALFEASFLDGANPPGLHLSAREAGAHAARAGVPRLLLTHLVAWNDDALSREQATQAYDGVLEVARPDTTYEV